MITTPPPPPPIQVYHIQVYNHCTTTTYTGMSSENTDLYTDRSHKQGPSLRLVRGYLARGSTGLIIGAPPPDLKQGLGGDRMPRSSIEGATVGRAANIEGAVTELLKSGNQLLLWRSYNFIWLGTIINLFGCSR